MDRIFKEIRLPISLHLRPIDIFLRQPQDERLTTIIFDKFGPLLHKIIYLYKWFEHAP